MGQRLRILDVGMGQGTQALRLARAGHQVTGLEQDATMLAVAREALAAEPEGIRGRVRLIEGDGRETGVHFLPGSFDVVLCHGVLMYVEEPDALLAGLARMLAPGGLLSLLVRNAITGSVDSRLRFKNRTYEAAVNVGLTHQDGEPAAVERVQRAVLVAEHGDLLAGDSGQDGGSGRRGRDRLHAVPGHGRLHA